MLSLFFVNNYPILNGSRNIYCRFLKLKTKFAAEDFGPVNFKINKNSFYDPMVHAY